MKRNSFKLKLALSDHDKELMDKARSSGKLKKLTARIEATHSGIVNKNKWFYTPTGMSDGTHTFVEPHGKPVLKNHDAESDALGRVVDAEYVSYHEVEDVGLKDTSDSASYYKKILDFVDGDLFNEDGYKGLGHILLTVEITDESAIEKLLDGRFLTVSISGDTEQAVCSICGQDKKNLKDGEESCDHFRGEMYDGKEAFYIAGRMAFEEVSFVNKPADENAKVSSLGDSISLEDNTSFQELEILDFEIKKTGDEKLKIKLSDLIADENLPGKLDDALKSLKLGHHVADEDGLKKLRKTSFLFSDERALPVNSGAYILAAYKVLDEVEDSKEKSDVLAVLDKKFTKEFGTMSLEDAAKSLELQEETIKDDKEVETQPAFDVDYDLIVDKITVKLKDLFNLDDSFLARRNEALEDEMSSLETENAKLVDSLRSTIILQILQAEDRISDEAYKEKLQTRTLDSLKDKLDDLSTEESVQDDNTESETDPKLNDSESEGEETSITETDVKIEDAVEGEGEATQETEESSDNDLNDNTQEGDESFSISEIRDEYRTLIRTKGMRAASDYLSDLRKVNKLPANFTFSK